MRRTRNSLRWALAGLLCVTASSPIFVSGDATAKKSKKAETPAFDMNVQSFTLDNGLRVLVVEDHSTPAFNINITYDVGSRDEVEGRTGFAHFFEHMMFMGTANVGPMMLGDYTEGAGGNINAATSFDQTFYYHDIPSQYLDMVLWAEADRLGGLELTQEKFETQRAAVKSERDRAFNQPQMKLFEAMLADVFAGTPYDHLPIGTLEDLNASEVADTQEFFDVYYRPNNAVLAIVGDVEFETVKERVTHYFGSIPKAADKPAPPKSEQVHGKAFDRTISDPEVKQPMYLFAWPTVGDDHPDRWALDLLGNALMAGNSSPIPRILVDEKKLAVAAQGGHGLVMRDAGAMFMIAVPAGDRDVEKEVQEVLRAELAKVAKKGLGKKDLEKAINQQVMQTISALETNSGRAAMIAQDELFYGDPKRVINNLEHYRAVTNDDIKRVAAQYINETWAFYRLQGN